MRYALLVVASLVLGIVAGRQTVRVPEREAAVVPAGPIVAPKSDTPTKREVVAIAPSPREITKRLEIPLSSIYCANYHKDGLRVPRRKDDEEFTEQWERLRKRLATMPYRTAFVVQSATIEGAVSDTLIVLDGRREGEAGLALSEELGRKSVWAVMFLGNTLAERELTFTSATYDVNELTVTVRVGEDRGETVGISVPNLYWVPLPEVQPGVLTLRIHDSETKSDLLVIRIGVQ